MSIKSLLEAGEFRLISTGAAAAQTDHDSDVIDLEGFDSVAFLVAMGAIVATATPRIAVHDADTNVFGTLVAATPQTSGDTDDNQLVIADMMRPKKRFLGVRVERDLVAADSTVLAIFAVLYNARDLAVVQDPAEVSASAVFVGAGN